MHSHPNARLTQKGRLWLVTQHLEYGRSLAELAVEWTPLTGEPEDCSVQVRAVTPADLNDLKDLDASLQEWSSSADDEAFADL